MKPPSSSEATSPTAIGWCHWHKGMGGDVRLIQVIEQGTGPGQHCFACPACRDKFHLTPYAD